MDPTCSLLLFRNEVKTRYASQPHVYHQLVQLLQRFNMKKIDIPQLKASIELLLADNTDLIQKFNVQMIMLQYPNARTSKMFCESSRDFVLKVKDVLEKKGKPEQYRSFVSILRNVGSSSLKDTLALVEVLFHEESQLLEEFKDMIMVEFLSEEKSVLPPTLSFSASARSPPSSPSASPAQARRPVACPSSNIVMSAQRRKPLVDMPKQMSTSAGALLTSGYTPLTDKVRSNTTASECPSETSESKGKNKLSKTKSDYIHKPNKKDSKLHKILPRSFTRSRADALTPKPKEDIEEEAHASKPQHISNRRKFQAAILRIGNHWKPVTSPPGSPTTSPRFEGSPLKRSAGVGETYVVQSVG